LALVNKERSVNDVKRIIHNLAEKDPLISKVIPKTEDEKNPLVRKLKEEVLSELYNNIELVLINSNSNANVS
jgi:hypothetical protein